MGLHCFAFGATVAAAAYLALRAFDRNPGGPSLLTAALAAGLPGHIALHLRCFQREAQHFLLGHFAVILLALLAAAAWSFARASRRL